MAGSPAARWSARPCNGYLPISPSIRWIQSSSTTISPNPVKTIFASEDAKAAMLDEALFRKAYVVDVDLTANGRQDYRAAPLTTKSTSRSPQIEQRRKRAQSGTGIVDPWCATWVATSGSAWWPQLLHHTMSRTLAASAWPKVIGDDSLSCRDRAI